MKRHRNRRGLPALWTIVVLALFGAVPAQSQPTNAVRVKLSDQCRDLQNKHPVLVVNGDEQIPAHLKKTDSPFEWSGEWHDPDKPKRQLASEGSCGSLRLQGTRTDCKLSSKKKQDDRIEAVFEFDCDGNPTRDVTIHAEPFLFSYVRFLRRKQHKPRDCDCGEQANSNQGTQTIFDVRVSTEVVHLGLECPHDILWMHLSEIADVSNLKKGISRTLHHDQVVQAIVRSTRGEEFSGNAYRNPSLSVKVKADTKIIVTVH
jgi:hypothetical protein